MGLVVSFRAIRTYVDGVLASRNNAEALLLLKRAFDDSALTNEEYAMILLESSHIFGKDFMKIYVDEIEDLRRAINNGIFGINCVDSRRQNSVREIEGFALKRYEQLEKEKAMIQATSGQPQESESIKGWGEW